MPTYNFRNKKTGEITEEFMSISAREAFLKKNKNLEPYIDEAPKFNYATRGFGTVTDKADSGFKEVMSKIAEAHPASDLAAKYGPKKSIKEIKTREAIKKHIKRSKETSKR
jgi:hypothetical protein